MTLRVASKARSLAALAKEPYVCQSCLLKTSVARLQQRVPQQRKQSTLRPPKDLSTAREIRKSKTISGAKYARRSVSNGSLASTTAINAPSTVPPAFRELHQRLQALQEEASSYVDLSRLQLATRSLESDGPVIRVALLGLGSNGMDGARKLARVILSDALAAEEEWEKELVQRVSDGRSLLLRYGSSEDAVQSSPLVQTINVPSPFLQRYRLEILVTAFNTGNETASMGDSAALEEAILVPPLTTPNSAGGRVGFVRYPVHKAIVVGEGITGAVEYGRLPAALTDGKLISAALSLPLRGYLDPESAQPEITGNAIDLDLATHAIDVFRSDSANGAKYSEAWQASGVPAVSEWLAGSTEANADTSLHPAVHSLITSILNRASISISISEDAETALATAATIPDPKRAVLQSAISEWSAFAHRDLQMNLDAAFQDSPSWRRTTWWRLFWRIDDVAISASDVLRISWLTNAEQRLAFLGGRIFDAGLATEEQLSGPAPTLFNESQKGKIERYEAQQPRAEPMAELAHVPSAFSRMLRMGINIMPPWPQFINLSRQYMLNTLVPALHAKAQALLVTALGTIGGSVALSGWFVFATAGHGLYESGAILALGFVWSLRRLQKKWGKEREDFAIAAREDARRVLADVDAHLRRLVNEGGRASVRLEDMKSWLEAREAVEGCRDALEKIQSEP